MNSTIGAGGPELQSRYESLRAQATARGQSVQQPQGMALLLHSGLAAWMVAWAQVTPQVAAHPMEDRDGDTQVVPAGQHAEVVVVLAAMVRASRQGGG